MLLTVPVAAQITFDALSLQTLVGQRIQTSVYLMDMQHYSALGTIVNASGGNQTYDFSGFTYGLPSGIAYDVLGSAAGTPGENDPYLGGANFVQVTDYGGGSIFYVYNNLTGTGYELLGSVFDQAIGGAMTRSISKNDPADRTYALPLTSGSAWNETFTSTSETSGITSQVTVAEDEMIDGWGTLITPAGTAPALRLRKVHAVPSDPNSITTTAYIFVSNTFMGASIILDDQGTVLSASYSMTSGGGGTTRVEETPPLAFRLEQNHPNPFSRDTSIAFELEQPGYVVLRVFDLLGREVAGLVDAQLPVGIYTADFRADGLSSGVYLYRLQVDEHVILRKLVLSR
jgi:hypothetical protein